MGTHSLITRDFGMVRILVFTGILLLLAFSCTGENTWTPTSGGSECDPAKKSTLTLHPSWKATFDSDKGRARACLRTSWGNEYTQNQGILIEVNKLGEVYGRGPEGTESFTNTRIAWQIPDQEEPPKEVRFTVFVFGVKRRGESLVDQEKHCKEVMGVPGYDCLQADERECWFAWNFSPSTKSETLKAAPIPKNNGSTCQLVYRVPFIPEKVTPESAVEKVSTESSSDLKSENIPEEMTTERMTDAGEGLIPEQGVNEKLPPEDVSIEKIPEKVPEKTCRPSKTIPCPGTLLSVKTLAGPGPVPTYKDGDPKFPWFLAPSGIAVDKTAKIVYISDRALHRVWKYDIKTKKISHVAGTGTPGKTDSTRLRATLRSPAGLAVRDGKVLYIADTGNHCIRKLDLNSGMVSTLAGGCGVLGSKDNVIASAARFNKPKGLAYVENKGLFIADSVNNCIRMWDLKTKKIVRIAGSCSSGVGGYKDDSTGIKATFTKPSGLIYDGSSLLYVADNGSNCIRTIDINNSQHKVETVAGACRSRAGYKDDSLKSAIFGHPGDLVLTGKETMFVAENRHRIRKVDFKTKTVATVVGSGTGRHKDANGIQAELFGPEGIATDGNNGLWIADTINSRLRYINLQAKGYPVTTPAGDLYFGTRTDTPRNSRFRRPVFAVYASRDDSIYFSEESNFCIRKLHMKAQKLEVLAGRCSVYGYTNGSRAAAQFQPVFGLVPGAAGELYVVDTGNSCIRKINTKTGETSTWIGACQKPGFSNGLALGAKFKHPSSMVLISNGDAYIVDTQNHCIRKYIKKSGQVVTFAGKCGFSGGGDANGEGARFLSPVGIAHDGNKTLYITDQGNNCIRQIDMNSSKVTTIAGVCRNNASGFANGSAGAAKFSKPHSIHFDKSTNALYITDAGNNCIRKLDLKTKMVSMLAGYCTFSGNVDQVSSQARFWLPQGLAAGPNGTLLIADTNNHSIRQLVIK